MSNRIQIGLLIIAIPLVVFVFYLSRHELTLNKFFLFEPPVVHIDDVRLRVEVADSDVEREKGLSGRKEFGTKYNGLLFIFPDSDYHGIWMKDMYFPIDIIWINDELVVTEITKSVSPDSYPYIFRPKQPAKYLIETDIHIVDTMGIRVGQKVKLPLDY